MPDKDDHITVRELFDSHGEQLQLLWVAGLQGGNKCLYAEEHHPGSQYDLDDEAEASIAHPITTEDTGKSLVGYLNLIHPHQIQILGSVELNYLRELREVVLEDTINQLLSQDPACIVIADGREPSTSLIEHCNSHGVPLFSSSQNSLQVADSLRYYLTSHFAETRILHGVFLEVMSIGVLLTGPSGIGKSEVALELIARGNSRLVADDAPSFSRVAPDTVRGSCPELLRDFLEVRGLGIINVRKLYGDNSIRSSKFLRLIIRLEYMNEEQLLHLDRMEGSYQDRTVLGLKIPEITLPVAPGRNLSVLLECAVRNHILRTGGYNAAEDFIQQQQQLIDERSNRP